MKTIGLLIAMLVLHAPALAAQTSLAAPMDPRLVVAPAEHRAAPVLAGARRDHVAGAAKGMVLGAVVGAVGLRGRPPRATGTAAAMGTIRCWRSR